MVLTGKGIRVFGQNKQEMSTSHRESMDPREFETQVQESHPDFVPASGIERKRPRADGKPTMKQTTFDEKPQLIYPKIPSGLDKTALLLWIGEWLSFSIENDWQIFTISRIHTSIMYERQAEQKAKRAPKPKAAADQVVKKEEIVVE